MSHTPEADSPETLQRLLDAPPRRARWIGVIAIVALALGGVALYALGAAPKREARQSVAERARTAASTVRRVQVATVRQAAEAVTIRQSATLEPRRRALVFAQVAGYLTERRVDVGDRVEQNQVLGVIATPVLEKELVESQSARDAAAAQLEDDRQALDLARRTLDRVTVAAQARATSQQDVDDAQTRVRRAAAAVERSTAALAQADAMIARLNRQLEFRELRAPFPGIVTRRTRDEGDYIEVGGNTTDPAVFTVVDAAVLRTSVRIPQAQAYLVRQGQSATVRVSGLQGLAIQGRVTRISSELDQATRTMPIEVEVPNDDARLIAGSYATVEIAAARPPEQRPALVPGNALMLLPTGSDGSGGGPTVGVLTGEAAPFKVEYRAVKLGRDFGSEVEVLAGLSPGERVLLNIPIPMSPETTVQPVDPPPAPGAAPAATPASPPPGRESPPQRG